jgi:flagellar hook-basal body complex protein FliE
MNILGSNKPFPLTPKGNIVDVFRNDDRHYGKTEEALSPERLAGDFGDLMRKTLETVNDQQVEADELTQKIIYDPNSVDVHDVLVASEKARMSLTFTKTMVDGVVKAYRELTSLR